MNILKYSKIATVVLLAATLMLAGCVGDRTPSVYAVVDGEEISREDFINYLNFQRFVYPEATEFTKEEQVDILDDMIGEKVYLNEAKRRGIELDKDKALKDYDNLRAQIIQGEYAGSATAYYARIQELDLTEDWIINLLEEYQLINNMIDEEQEKAVLPDDEEIEAFYEKEKDTVFARGERRQVRHILVNDGNFPDADEDDVPALAKDLAQEIYDRIVAGEDFAELAAEFSQDTSADDGGNIGFIERSEVVKEFGDVAFSSETEVNKVAEPVESTYGWHVLEVIEIEEPGHYELDEEMRAWISQVLYQQEMKDLVTALLKNLVDEADIQNNLK